MGDSQAVVLAQHAQTPIAFFAFLAFQKLQASLVIALSAIPQTLAPLV